MYEHILRKCAKSVFVCKRRSTTNRGGKEGREGGDGGRSSHPWTPLRPTGRPMAVDVSVVESIFILSTPMTLS